jgi:phosphate transport system substrate-binding protein
MMFRIGFSRSVLCLLLAGAALVLCGCGRKSASRHAVATIQNKGSDTMVNVAQAWAEEYKVVRPDVAIEVSGGGSGQGIAALIKGAVDMANCSRNMKQDEMNLAKSNTGRDPVEFIVGFDAHWQFSFMRAIPSRKSLLSSFTRSMLSKEKPRTGPIWE